AVERAAIRKQRLGDVVADDGNMGRTVVFFVREVAAFLEVFGRELDGVGRCTYQSDAVRLEAGHFCGNHTAIDGRRDEQRVRDVFDIAGEALDDFAVFLLHRAPPAFFGGREGAAGVARGFVEKDVVRTQFLEEQHHGGAQAGHQRGNGDNRRNANDDAQD